MRKHRIQMQAALKDKLITLRQWTQQLTNHNQAIHLDLDIKHLPTTPKEEVLVTQSKCQGWLTHMMS